MQVPVTPSVSVSSPAHASWGRRSRLALARRRTISAAEELIVALTAAIADLRGQEAQMPAKMRAVAEAVADRDHPIDPR